MFVWCHVRTQEPCLLQTKALETLLLLSRLPSRSLVLHTNLHIFMSSYGKVRPGGWGAPGLSHAAISGWDLRDGGALG